MNITQILESKKALLLEAGVRIPDNIESFRILHHNDADGLGSAKALLTQIQNQMMKKWRAENKKIGSKRAQEMSDRELISAINSRVVFSKVTDGMDPKEVLKQIKNTGPNQFLAVVDFDRFSQFGEEVMNAIKQRGGFDFHSDHHQTIEKMIAKQGRTGATEFKSDTDHIVTKRLTKGFDPATALRFTKWDSANFDENIKKELGLEPGDPKYKEIRELHTILSQISRGKYHKTAVDYFLKEAPNSIYGMINYAKKLRKAINLQDAATRKMKERVKKKKAGKKLDPEEEKERVEKAKEEAKIIQKQIEKMGFPKLAKEITSDFKSVYLRPREEMIQGTKEYMKAQERGEGPYVGANKYVVISELSGKNQPNRYLSFAIPNNIDPEMKRYLSAIRYWEGMGFMQASISPDAPDEVKEKVDLGKVTEEVIDAMQEKFGNKFNGWAFERIRDEAGGHKGITNLGGFGMLGLMPKKFREEQKDLKKIVDRIKSINKFRGNSKKAKQAKENFLERNPGIKKKLERFEELGEEKQKWMENKKEIMKFAKDKYAELIEREMKKALGESAKNEILKLI